jgi:transcriptional regulator with GAF, ATPase, and Fis domain
MSFDPSPFESFLASIAPLLPRGWGASLQLEDALTSVLEEVASTDGEIARRARWLVPALLPEGFGDPPEPWRLARAGIETHRVFPLAGERPFGRLLLVAAAGAAPFDPGSAARIAELAGEAGGELERARSRRENEKFTARLRRITEAELADRYTEALVGLAPEIPFAAVFALRDDRLVLLVARSREGSEDSLVLRSVPFAGSHLAAIVGHDGGSAAPSEIPPERLDRFSEGGPLAGLSARLGVGRIETVPLEPPGRLAGSLLLFHRKDRTDPEARLLIGRLSADFALALDRVRPERQQASSFLYLQEILHSPGRALSVIFGNVVEEMNRFLGSDAGSLVLLESDSGSLLLSESRGYEGPPLPESLPLEPAGGARRSIAAEVARSGAPYLASDTRSSPVYLVTDPSIRSELGVPLRLRGETIGVLIASSRTPGFFAPGDLPRSQLFADQVVLAVHNARLLDALRIRRERDAARRQRRELGFDRAAHAADVEYHFGNLVGDPDGPMGEVYRLILRIAPREEEAVLVAGETGSGKEMVAAAIHHASARKARPMVATNFASLGGDPNLIQSELFGHERGAFTGASARRRGCFEQAHRSTLLLDEIGDVVPSVQVKLLRVLGRSSLRKFQRLGGEETIESDVRLLAATNKPLLEEIRAGRFREDLYYRLSALVIRIPPLRDRPGDIPLLARHILARSAPGERVRFGPGALDLLLRYRWPGNVRQLESTLLRAFVLHSRDGEISVDDLRRSLEAEEGWEAEGGSAVPPLVLPDPIPPGWFWDEVWSGWKGRRIGRAELEPLLRRLLAESGGFWSRVAERLGIEPDETPRFLDFLRNSGLKIDHREFRKKRPPRG